MASIKFELDTRRESKSELYNICLRLYHKGENDRINLGVKVKKDCDDFSILENGSIKLEKCDYLKNITRTTNFLNKKKYEADEIIENLRLTNKLDHLSFKELKRLVSKNESNISITDFIEEQRKILEQSQRFGTADTKVDTLSVLRRFTGRQDVSFEEVDNLFLKKLEAWWLEQDNVLNGLAPKLRDIRNAFNEAIKDSRIQIKKEESPFVNFKIKTEKTRKRSINIDALKKFMSYIPTTENEVMVKDIFMFMFINAGMNLVDLWKLKIKNIKTDRLIYNRSKTKDSSFNWEIGPDAHAILDKYIVGKGDDDYVFPIVLYPELKGRELKEHVRSRHIVINKILKRIAKKVGIEENLTSYVARHSWATLAKRTGIPVASIRDALGHSKIDTTQKYLADLEDDEMNAINKQIGGLVFGDPHKTPTAPGNQPDAINHE